MDIFNELKDDLTEVAVESIQQDPVKSLPGIHIQPHIKAYCQKLDNLKDAIQFLNNTKQATGISQESVKLMNMRFEDLLKQDICLEQFTIKPSKLFQPELITTLKLKVAKESDELYQECKVFFKEPFEEIEQFHHHVQKYYMGMVEQTLYKIKSYQEVLDQYQHSNNFHVPTTSGSFINIIKDPIANVKGITIEIPELTELCVHFKQASENIYNIMDKEYMQLLIVALTCKYSFEQFYNLYKMNTPGIQQDAIRYSHLLDAYKNNHLTLLLQEISVELGKVVDKMRGIKNQMDCPTFTETDLDQYFLEDSANYIELFNKLEFIEGILRNVLWLQTSLIHTLPLLKQIM